MKIKTTINIKKSLFDKISTIASQYNVTMSSIVNSVARKAISYYSHKDRFLQRVSYQERLSGDSDSWHRMPVSFLPDVYEKCLDVRKLSKISVSFFISFAFEKFLNQVIYELEQGEVSDNYTANYLLLYTQQGFLKQITLLWDMIEPEKIIKLQNIHRE